MGGAMSAKWTKKRVLITVKTYPVPSQSSIEVSCTAGVTDSGEWIRLFPIPYRILQEDGRFSKYQWIKADVTKPRDDQRPESYKLNASSIEIMEPISTADEWRERRRLVRDLIKPSMCSIRAEQMANRSPTLGLFKPGKIARLIIEDDDPEWTPKQLDALAQQNLFDEGPAQRLEKIPYRFKYEYTCNNSDCNGHSMTCTDWEMGQAYRKWRREYGDEWERPFRKKFEVDMISKFDTHFYVGTIHQHPNNWIIIGLFYPPYETTRDLFG